MKILITGVGFIGYHLAVKFLNQNYDVVGIDNIIHIDVNWKTIG